jgi:hypothetical protein
MEADTDQAWEICDKSKALQITRKLSRPDTTTNNEKTKGGKS